ncbi:MAG: hypothetical protein RR890_07900 [Longicatena sp.]
MKKYKEELDRFSLTKEHKQALKNAMMEPSFTPKRKQHVLIFASVICLVLLSVVLLQKQMPHQAEPIAINKIEDEVSYEQCYKPQWYRSYGGLGISKKMDSSSPFLEIKKNETRTIQTDIKELSVYEYERTKNERGEFKRYDDEEYRITLSAIANKLGIHNALTSDVRDRVYKIESDKLTLRVKENDSVSIIGNERYASDISSDAKQMVELAKTFFPQVQSATDIKNPTYQLLTRNNTYEVMINEKAKEQKSVVFSIEETYDTKTSEPIFCPSINIPNVKHQREIGKLSILDVKEATKTLLEGGYTSNNIPVFSLTSKNIVGVELIYSDDTFINYLPYRLPIYRFYVNVKDTIYSADVIATSREELEKLEKVSWYFK